jgi:hypothetical protein
MLRTEKRRENSNRCVYFLNRDGPLTFSLRRPARSRGDFEQSARFAGGKIRPDVRTARTASLTAVAADGLWCAQLFHHWMRQSSNGPPFANGVCHLQLNHAEHRESREINLASFADALDLRVDLSVFVTDRFVAWRRRTDLSRRPIDAAAAHAAPVGHPGRNSSRGPGRWR